MSTAAKSTSKGTPSGDRDGTLTELSLANAPCFIERQFPVAKVSTESYAERRANQSQSITSLGKWWGRKPLILVRATLLGLLLPSTDDPSRDREIFLKLLTMDEEGLRRRKDKSIPGKRLVEELLRLPPSIQRRFLDESASPERPQVKRLSRDERAVLQMLVFERMSYSEKLEYCCRPEELDGPSPDAWRDINGHLNTSADSLTTLVEELGIRRFGHRPRLGDAFCGAGSIPFEAARLGCDAYASDLSPVAALMTWAALNIVGGDAQTVERIIDSQRRVFESAERQLLEWGIEENEQGWRIDALLYCTEVLDPETGWLVPLAPHWAIAPTGRIIARLVPDQTQRRYEIELIQNATDDEISEARDSGTIREGYVVHPILTELDRQPASIDMIRASNRGLETDTSYHESGLRLWSADDLVPRPTDVFQERLYCIRWEETYYELTGERGIIELSKTHAESMQGFDDLIQRGQLRRKTRRHYRAPQHSDHQRELRALNLLRERLPAWTSEGLLPRRRIEPGVKTTEPIRTRGWTYWHHLFTPRQLLTIGLLQERSLRECRNVDERVANLLSVGRFADWNSKLCRWGTGAARESIGQTFTNQALNTLLTFASKGFTLSSGTWFMALKPEHFKTKSSIEPIDARTVSHECDLWITDPPYADAIVYHELTEYFLAWYEGQLSSLFPSWYSDSKRALAVQGSDHSFRHAMIACYGRLATMMPANGLQVVMFTHQDASVWADLATILWAAGLHVTAAWCIQTEREAAGVREGNYVQGTVLMVLRKRTTEDPAFLDETSHRVENEVRQQLNAMLAIEDDSDPNFTDTDYQLAAYAAALRVLTERPIEEIDPAREVARQRGPGEVSPIESLIRNAVKIACDHLVPKGIDRESWKLLSPSERFYLKGLEVESHGERRSGVYQELARGYGATNYDDLLGSGRANQSRLKTASELGRRMLSGEGFATSFVRQVLFAVQQVAQTDETIAGLNWLKTELADYWGIRERILHILDYVSKLDKVAGMDHWQADSEAARLLAGAVRNDHI